MMEARASRKIQNIISKDSCLSKFIKRKTEHDKHYNDSTKRLKHEQIKILGTKVSKDNINQLFKKLNDETIIKMEEIFKNIKK